MLGVCAGHARLDLEVSIYDAANMDKVLCKMTMEDVKAGKGQFDTASRVSEAYAKAGKELAKFIMKNSKK